MSAFFDRVSFTTSTVGSGAIDVGAAVAKYRTPSGASVPSGTLVSYVIEDGNAWETGRGTLTSGTPWTMTRGLVESSTGSLLALSGSATVFLTVLASDLDTLGGGSGASVSEVSIDLGTVPRWSHRVSFALTAEAGQRVLMTPSGDDGDEAEMDGLTCAARVTATDTIEAFIVAHPGPVAGVRTFNILLG